jgi:hypothetical protein
MIHNDIQNQLALLIKAAAPPLIEIADSPVETPQWIPGQRLPAHIIASLPNGRFQVEVGNQMLDMNLPRNSEPGQTIELTFISSQPRLTFALTQQLAHALPPNGSVSLSEAAKFLGALMQRGSSPSASAATLQGAAPILQGAPANIADFAAALQAAFSKSGLFYEAHQAQWVAGERTLAHLLQEPQAQLPPLAQSAGKAATAPVPPPSGPSLDRARAEGATTEKMSVPVHPQAQPLVQRQLESLDHGQVMWQGQVWPGQEMRWEIREDDAHRGGSGSTPAVWMTRLRLDLPQLGSVTAQLAVNSANVRIDLVVERDATADRLRDALGDLARSMEASGLKMSEARVRGEKRGE